MNPSEFLDVLGRLAGLLGKGSANLTFKERNAIRSVVGAWLAEYRPSFLAMVGDESRLRVIDENMNALVKLAALDSPKRTAAVRRFGAIKRHFLNELLVPLSRAYWSRAPERTAAGRDADVANRLRLLDADLADSYEQAVADLEDEGRLSYRGPAGELREGLTSVLHLLAPTADVQATEWHRE